ncbi:MAG TPA: hemin uptake protein HemP [Burkholderiales bacterium]|nr:hemin uptake protein HemP [Burkholderiales bacterium]
MRTIIVRKMQAQIGPKAPDLHPVGPAQRRVRSEELLGREREIVILHNGREYRLRLTQSGKLILTA